MTRNTFLRIGIHIILTGSIGWLLSLQQMWVSCGCWDNPKPKLYSAVFAYSITLTLLFKNAARSTRLLRSPLYILTIITYNSYLLHYALPFRLIPRIGDTAFILGSTIPVIGSAIAAILTTISIIKDPAEKSTNQAQATNIDWPPADQQQNKRIMNKINE
jgi:hypothetical protein